MILKKLITKKTELYIVEIDTNDEKENVVSLYQIGREVQPIMQIKYPKTENEDYIELAKDIVLKYENGDKNACGDFFKWDGCMFYESDIKK